jgi:flagellar motor switch protein FliM
VLAKTTITLRDLSEMKPGDLIVTSTPAKDPSMVLVGGEPKFRAVVGQHKGKRAIKITRTVARGERSQSRLSS